MCSCDWILVYGMRVELNYAICVARFLKVGLSYVLTLSLFNHQVCVYVLSCVWLFVTPWTVTCQAPQSLELSRQEYWSGLPFPPLGIFLTQGLNLHLLCLLHCQADFFFFFFNHWANLEAPTIRYRWQQSPELSETSRWKEMNHHKEESPSPNK